MKTDEAIREQVRIALDRRLSGVTERPGSRQRVLRLVRGEEKIVKKKISTGLVLVLALLVATMAVALATGGFGLLDFKRDQANNKTFIEHIVPVGQTFEDDYLTLTVNEAVFNGATLSFTMDIAPKNADDPVFIIPAITAEADGKTLRARAEGATGNFTESGFWLPGMDPRVEEETRFGVEATLLGLQGGEKNYDVPDGDVEWRLSFTILRPNWPISYVELTLPSDDSDDVLTDEMDERYDRLFAEAYADHRILLAPDGSLFTYVAMMPQPDGIPGGEKGQDELQKVLEQSDAFTIADCPVIAFTTANVAKPSAAVGQTFDFADGWHAELTGLSVTFDRVDCSMRVTRDLADGPSLEQLWEKGDYWTFAILADGATTAPYASSEGIREDGSYGWQATVTLSAPTTRISFVPCRTTDEVEGEPAPDGYVPIYDTQHMVYQNQAPYTEEQKGMTFSIDVQ